MITRPSDCLLLERKGMVPYVWRVVNHHGTRIRKPDIFCLLPDASLNIHFSASPGQLNGSELFHLWSGFFR